MTTNLLTFPPELTFPPKRVGGLGWAEATGSSARGLASPTLHPPIPGAPALGLELGGEQPSQRAVDQEGDDGGPRLRLRLQGRRRGGHAWRARVFHAATRGQNCQGKGGPLSVISDKPSSQPNSATSMGLPRLWVQNWGGGAGAHEGTWAPGSGLGTWEAAGLARESLPGGLAGGIWGPAWGSRTRPRGHPRPSPSCGDSRGDWEGRST